MLLYVPKRIHFGSQTFKMRMNLAILDWVSGITFYYYTYHYSDSLYFVSLHVLIIFSQNENVQRGHTSERTYVDIRRPNRRTALKVLVNKTFRFVEDVWSTYVRRNMQVTGYVHTTILCCSKHEINIYCFSRTTVASGEGDEDEEEGQGDDSDLEDDGDDVQEDDGDET